MIYQNLSWFYRWKMVISQFATVKIQLNHPKIIPMAQGDPRGTWIPRSDDWGDALAAQQISRSSPVSATVPWGSKNSVGSGCRLDPGSQNKPKSPEKNWKKNANFGDFELSFGGRWLRWFFWIHHSWVDSDQKTRWIWNWWCLPPPSITFQVLVVVIQEGFGTSAFLM